MSKTKKIVVIGGSAAGPKAAAKARRMDQHAEITLIQKAPDLSMAACGYPYYIEGVFDDRNQLLCTPTGVTRNPQFFLNAKNITAIVNTEVTNICRKRKIVECKNIGNENTTTHHYDKLVIATGSTPVTPKIPGSELDGISTLQSMHDADYLRKIRDEGKVKKAVIIGGGFIGIETCEALNASDIKITLVEMSPQILPFLDWELAKILETHIKSKGVNIIVENPVVEFLGNDGKLCGVKLKDGTTLSCELAVMAIGVRPNSKLAREAGIEIGKTGGIRVNDFMQTSDSDIYAAGDCIEIKNLITQKKVHAPFGDLANLQGRVIGQNIVKENTATFSGTIQTGVCKVFDFSAGITGISEEFAKKEKLEHVTSVTIASPDKPGFMGGQLLIIKMLANAKNGKILGTQCIGLGDVSKRLATAAMAIQGGMTVATLSNADLPYAPPFSPAIDNVIAAAHVLQNKILGYMKGISSIDLKAKLDAGDEMFILDTRGPDENEQMQLGIGETLIPLGALRKRINELPSDKDKEIICFCKISLRGYEAASYLEANGWTNVKVLEGGIMAWPYERKK